MSKEKNRYSEIIEYIFNSHYQSGMEEIFFERQEITQASKALGIENIKNLGDLLYSFRYRTNLPDSIKKRAPAGKEWAILPAGRARYRFHAREYTAILPNPLIGATKIPDATPGIIAMYAQNDEQALLAQLRYNRIVDIFTGVTCYSLQNHLRTTVPEVGQIETDEIYLGIDKRGAHYVFPVQAKGKTDRLNVVAIEQDLALCATKFPHLIRFSIAAQFMEGDLIALFLFEDRDSQAVLLRENHYLLVPADDISAQDIDSYRNRPVNE